MLRLFTAHPTSIGETYLEHLLFASKFGLQMLIGGFACLLHAILPFMFASTGSDYLFRMMHEFIARMPANDERLVKLAKLMESKK